MKPKDIALVAPADKSRLQIARYLRDASYHVTECDELSIATRFFGVVLVDDDTVSEVMRARVQSWIKQAHPPRVVVISSRPAGWKTLSLTLVDHLIVLAAPSFGWEIVDALRVNPPEQPGQA
jgi:hypothetical protein